MRVATKSLYQGIQQRILNLSSALKKVNEKVASGKNFSRPSDAPVSMVSALGLRTTLSHIEQYQRNMEIGKLWLNLSETAINQTSGLADRAQKIALQMSNGTQMEETRAILAAEVGHLLDQAISLGNTQLAGKYIFAGYRTRTAPFSRTTVGGIETAEYRGDANDFEIRIGKDEKVSVGKNGQAVFVDTGLFDALGTLKAAIENNDVNLIRQQAGILQQVEDSLNIRLADVGIRQNRLMGKQEVLATLNKNIQDRLADTENIDYARAILELKERQTAYEVALAASAKISELSLQDYLR
ncbi:MAG: flagellar hook-associated protein 3 [Deltaproteobacteria bacterium]|nr:flagellar hook-associated protein 3 [Deltaproteobacteria bacterium]